MLESPPLVSVVVPAYNGERTVLRALSSVVRQKHRPMELIVIDDASRDSTASLARDFVGKNGSLDEFRLLRHDVNLGLSRSLNDGVREARGDYVLILHQDCELMLDDWIGTALSFMKDEQVAVVTGYYGISDRRDESFVKRAFGVLRKQFHSRPKIASEEVTFSEGKCDLYRKGQLLKIGGFPTRYRIAGEDLVVSYGLRRLGYKIIKCYDLPDAQRFDGPAASFLGNLGKEFLFGKVMGGVFSEFKLFLFKGLHNSTYSQSRSLNRASQPLFILTLTSVLIMFLLFHSWIWLFLALMLVGVRLCYYLVRVVGELKSYRYAVSHPLAESFLVAFFGVLTDIFYSLGFGYGFLTYQLRKGL